MIEAPLLILLLAMPAIAAVVVGALPAAHAALRAPIARAAAWATAAWSALIVLRFEAGVGEPQFAQSWGWLRGLGRDGDAVLTGRLGVDGLNVAAIALIAFVTPLVTRLTAPDGDRRERTFWSAALALEFAALGAVLSLDASLFAAFVAASAFPLLLLLGIWGGAGKLDAATQGPAHVLIGAIAFATAGIVGLGDADAGGLALALGTVGLVAFAPLPPLHRAFVAASTQGPPHTAIWTTAIAPLVGVVGFTRFVAPSIAASAPAFLAFATLAAIYAALLALRARELHALVAYAVVAECAIAIAGAATGSEAGRSGATVLAASVGLGAAGLAVVLLGLRRRRGSGDVDRFGGVAGPMPVAALAFVAFAAAIVALPGSPGFAGGWLILDAVGDFGTAWVALLVAAQVLVVAALAAGFRVVMLGPCSKRNAKLADLDRRERVVVFALLVTIVALGVVPRAIVDRVGPSATANAPRAEVRR